MKIIEVRDGFIKFEANSDIGLSSFVKISDEDKNYVAQVIQLKKNDAQSIAYSKILFLYDGELINYDSTLPSLDSKIELFMSNLIENAISSDTPVISGKTYVNKLNIMVDLSAYNKKMLASIDNPENNNILVRNLAHQFNYLNKKVVIIDTLGIINAKKYIAGIDFKLPLNTESLAFIYRECLNEATSDSKSMIIEIFKDLSEYSETVPFVPFDTLKSIVNDMVDKSHIFKLLVLKNKLAKLDKLGYFAKNHKEFASLKNSLASKCVILDFSKLEPSFLNQYISYVYSLLDGNTQVLFEASNNVSKKSIKNILSSNAATTFLTHSGFKFLNEIKSLFDNFIIEPSVINNDTFSLYKTMLTAMPQRTYLLAGEALNYIPFVSSFENIQDVPNIVQKTSANKLDSIKDNSKQENISAQEENEDIINNPYIEHINNKSEQIIEETSKNLVMPENIEMFGEEEPDNEVEMPDAMAELVSEEVDELKIEDLENEPSYANNQTMFNIEGKTIQTNDYPTEIHVSEIENNIIDTSDYEEIIDTEPVNEVLNDNTLEKSEADTENKISEENEESATIEEYNNNSSDIEEVDDYSLLNEEIDNTTLQQDAANELDVEENVSMEIDDSFNINLNQEDEDISKNKSQALQEDETIPEKDDNKNIINEFSEFDPNSVSDDDIIIDISDEDSLTPEKEEQIVQDVDKVFTTRKDDEISDSDLDLIDELNSSEPLELEEYSDSDNLLEELETQDDNILTDASVSEPLQEISDSKEILETKQASTPLVPVYDAEIPQEDLVISDPIEQGDSVIHAKHGVGVVEKMIKYGNKTLYSINFENVGRRVLDPTLTEIKKA